MKHQDKADNQAVNRSGITALDDILVTIAIFALMANHPIVQQALT